MFKIVPYDPNWPKEFSTIGKELRQSLGSLAMRIDHIGSTSVPDLDAKDCIDIQITVKELSEAVENRLTSLGYFRREYLCDHIPPGFPEVPEEWMKWYFKPPDHQRPTNVHVRMPGRANQRYPLLFRDYLRHHPQTALAYANLKYRLLNELRDPKQYPDVKDPAVDLIYFAAEAWAKTTQWHPGPTDA